MDEQSEKWPKPQPEIETERLMLRPLALSDANTLQLLAGDFSIADTTLNIPHPYLDGVAQHWISSHPAQYAEGCQATFGLVLKEDGRLIGVTGLGLTKRFHRAELGYWITKELWGRGYATESAQAVVQFGFSRLALHKIEATHLKRNPSSGRVLQKLGFVQEGLLRDHVIKWNRFEDVVIYGLLHPFPPCPVMNVRKYNVGEENDLWDLRCQTTRLIIGKDYSSEQIARWAPDQVEDGWAQRLAKTNPFVVEHEGKIIGFADLERNGHIDQFYCHHQWQGVGVGEKLLRAIEFEAAKLGIRRLFLESSLTARSYFLRQGFEVTREERNLICGSPAPRFHMVKSLNAETISR